MRREDLDEIERVWPEWAKMIDPKHICALSPDRREIELLKSLFPSSSVSTVTIDSWHLNHPCPASYDLVVACNVFFCSEMPTIWFENVLDACNRFWLQDSINGRRSPRHDYMSGLQHYLGDDGDHMRYSMPPDHASDFEGAFDLRELDEHIIDFVPYEVDVGVEHFLLSLRGRLI